MRSPLATCLLLLASGCAERPAVVPPPTDPPPSPSVAVADSADAGAPAPSGTATAAAPALTWIDAVRLERWPDAAALLDALPEATRGRPEMRYVRARAAVGTGDGARAVALLEGVDAALPLLAADVARWRAEAQLLAGPYAPGAAYFARSPRSRDLVRAAEAYEKAGDTASARLTADRAVAAAARARSTRDEAAARMKRAEIALAHGGEAAAEPDLRWVATRTAGSAEGRAAAEALERMKRPLSPRERLSAIDGLVESGSPEAAPLIERMATGLGAAAGRSMSRGEVLHARAMALFRARSFPEAAKIFREAAAAGSGHEAEDLHYAGRSLARAGRDEEAVKAYREVGARYPRSLFADRSAYHAARLELQDGHFKEAARAYGHYLVTYRRGERRDDAEYERALSLLSSGSAQLARKSLEALARKAPSDKAGRLRELEAIAAERAGDRPGAVAMWTEIARTQPLTWAAMASRARLAAAGAPAPPLIDPPPAGGAGGGLDLRLPAGPALLSSVGLDGDAELHLAAAEHEASARFPGREGEALCGLYGLLSRAKRRYRVGVNAVDGGLLMRAPSERERWAWECVYPQPFAGGVRALEEEHGLPRGLVYAVMRQESAFDPAIVSPASAVGLMQLMPSTAKQAAGELSLPFDDADLTRPDYNLRLGVFYIAKLLKMFQGHVLLAAAAYNAGPQAVSHWLEAGSDNDVDLWVARIPFDETRNYVARVAQNLARYQWLSGGDPAVTPWSLPLPAGAKAPADAY
jgi:soluble lytic murein transglycosylase